MESEFEFDIRKYANENFRCTEARIRNKGRGQAWDFFDPEDLANFAFTKLWIRSLEEPDIFLEKESVDRLFSTILRGVWIDEVRRELEVRNLHGSGAVCVSLFSELDGQVGQLGLEFDVALRELLEFIKENLSERNCEIIDLVLDGEKQSDIALILDVSESTIDRDIASLKKAIVEALGVHRRTENKQRRTSNVQRPTSNVQRPTSNVQRPTSNVQRPTSNVQRPTSNVQRGGNPS